MECSCEIDVGIDDGCPDFTSTKMFTAKKDHKCIECKGVIKKGEQYEKTVGKWDGNFDTFKTCWTALASAESFSVAGTTMAGSGKILKPMSMQLELKSQKNACRTCLRLPVERRATSSRRGGKRTINAGSNPASYTKQNI